MWPGSGPGARCHDGFFDLGDHRLVKKGTTLSVRASFGVDIGGLVQRNLGAVIVHSEVFQQTGVRATGANLRQFGL